MRSALCVSIRSRDAGVYRRRHGSSASQGTVLPPADQVQPGAIVANAIEYAIERRLLSSNPIKAVKWTAPKTTQEVDRRSVVNPAQARRLLGAVRQQMPSGPRLVAFFAVIYYAALRPEEAVDLRGDNIALPPLVLNTATGQWEEPADNWGELRFCSAAPEAGIEWTDDGGAASNGSESPVPSGSGAGYLSPRR